jgi:hypothetical protein
MVMGPKLRLTVLAIDSSNLTDQPTVYGWTMLHDSQRRNTVKYGHESRGTRNQE